MHKTPKINAFHRSTACGAWGGVRRWGGFTRDENLASVFGFADGGVNYQLLGMFELREKRGRNYWDAKGENAEEAHAKSLSGCGPPCLRG